MGFQLVSSLEAAEILDKILIRQCIPAESRDMQ